MDYRNARNQEPASPSQEELRSHDVEDTRGDFSYASSKLSLASGQASIHRATPITTFGSNNGASHTGPAFSLELPQQSPSWPSGAPVRRQLDPQEWEKLKPMIIQLYMLENKTYKEVAEILLKDHNFHPT